MKSWEDPKSVRRNSTWKYVGAYRDMSERNIRLVYAIKSGLVFNFAVIKIIGYDSKTGGCEAYTFKMWKGDWDRTVSSWRTNIQFPATDNLRELGLQILQVAFKEMKMSKQIYA